MGFKKPNLKPKVAKTPTTKGSSTPTKPQSKPTTPKENAVPQKRNIKSLVIYGLLGLVILTLIIALVLLFVLYNKSENVCKTAECINLANQLHNFKDDSVDPCDDFYKYSCGKYIEHVSVEGARLLKKDGIMKGLIKEFILKNATTTSKSENALKLLYSKCEDIKNPIPISAIESYFDIISKVEQFGWPMKDSNFDLTDLLLKTRLTTALKMEVSFGLFSIVVLGARKVAIAKSEEAFSKENMTTVLKEVYDDDYIKFDATMNGIESFSKKLYNITPTNELIPTDYLKLKSSLPAVELDSIFQEISGSRNLKEIYKNVHGYGGFEVLAPRIQDLILNEKTNLGNYLIFRYIWSAVGHIQAAPKFPCDAYVVEYLPWPATRVYVRNHFDKDSLKDVEELVEDIRASFVQMFEDSKWLDDSTKKKGIHKAEKMKKVVGYAKEFEKAGELDKIFDVNILPDDTLHTTLKKIEHFNIKVRLQYGLFGTHMHPGHTLASNAFYLMTENSLSVLTPLIDDPIYHPSYPTYAKLAGAGFVIGHEIGHGFDARGATFDENGDPKMWWTPSNYKEFQNRYTCLIDQYNKYDDPSFGRKMNGTHAVGENMADNLGNMAIWKAFKKLELSNEKKIFGFEDYSIEKLYFQIEALTWCAPRSTIPLGQQLQDTHATSSFRVNGVFANMKEFSETFNCPAGSPMNPTKKCELF